jgi:pimeloyl-ACP methyl ester carboxylesterase
VIERQGARIGYEVTGSGPTVVLGHSLLCDGRMWEGVVPELLRAHRVVNVDFRGHRRSRAPAPFTLEELADDWLAILDAEGIERAALCGLSMGGMTAMRLALAHPTRVAALVLVDSNAEPERPRQRLQYRLMAEIVRAFGHVAPLYRVVERILFGATARREQPELCRREIERVREKDPAELYHAVRAVIGRASIERDLGAVRCPTLVLVGSEDVATPPERSARIARAVPGATLREIPRAGHLSALEEPDAVARAITEFLAAVPW